MTAPIIENNYTGDGSTVLFSFTFEYIEATDIEVSVDSVTVATTAYSLANATTVEFVTAPAVGAAIRIYRNTTVTTPKAEFFPGSAIRAQDLNDNFEQILFVTQEADAISERAEAAADAAEIATAAAQASAASATAAGAAAQASAASAAADAASAQADAAQAATDAAAANTTANAANATANTANTNATQAAADASAAASSASAAAASASTATTSAANAQTSANNALTQATQAATDASAAQTSATNAASSAATAASDAATANTNANNAVSTANTAASDATTAINTANSAVSTANTASSTATTASNDAATAISTANSAVTTANSAVTTAQGAVTTANTANTTANTANTTAGNAVTTANSAVTTANSASTTASNAVATANAAAAAVSDAYLFTVVANVSSIPSNPSDEDAVRVANSTGIESSSVVQGVPSGFTGDSGINVEIIYNSSASKWDYIAYNANDPDDRYGYPPYVDVTRQNTVDAATLSGRPLNSTHLGTFTGSTIADSSTVKAALQSLETEVETKADLVGGTVPTSQLPALAITTFLGTVANQTAMLALSGQRGDFAIRSDTSTTFVLTSDGGSNLSDWQELETPTIPIASVNGQTGTVVLGPSDVGALSTGGGTLTGNVSFNSKINFDNGGNVLDFIDNVAARFGTGNDLRIYHDGNHSQIKDSGTGNLQLLTSAFKVLSSDGSETYISAVRDGSVELYHNDSKKFDTVSGGTRIYGYLSMQGSGGHVYLPDSAQLKVGNGEDLKIYHDGGNSWVREEGTGALYIDSNGSAVIISKGGASEKLAAFYTDGAAELYYNNSKKLETKSDGVDVTGELQCDSLDVDGGADITGNVNFHGHVDLQDNDKLRLGNGGDLEVYHDATDSFVNNYTGGLLLVNQANDADINIQTDNGNGGTTNYIVCDGSDGNVRLYHYGNQKLQTESGGIDVTGTVKSDGLDVDGNGDISGTLFLHGNLDMQDNDQIVIGNDDDLRLVHDGSNSYITNYTGQLIFRTVSNEVSAAFVPNAEAKLYHNNSLKFVTKSDGIDVTGEVQCDSLDVDGSADISSNAIVHNNFGINQSSPSATCDINNGSRSHTALEVNSAHNTAIGIFQIHTDNGYSGDGFKFHHTRGQTNAMNFMAFDSNHGGSPDREFTFRGDGHAYCDNSWNGGGADYAEYFESTNGLLIPVGTTVVLENNKVRAATADDPLAAIIGVVRPKEPGIVTAATGNSAWNRWQQKYLTDDFDRYILDEHVVYEWTEEVEDGEDIIHSYASHQIPEGLTIPDDVVGQTHDVKGNRYVHYRLNPDYDPDQTYIPREDRYEWQIVGLVGQVKLLAGQPVNDRWIKMRDVSETVEEWFIR